MTSIPTSSYSSLAQAISSLSSTANTTFASPSSAQPNAFKAPAHKHAHRLHSIPPREKSTRTLIIDHILWVHGRTRFAQARAELGMTDPTGGPASSNYKHRNRPEEYDEEDEVSSDGEDTSMLRGRTGDPGRPHDDSEDERLKGQDLSLARNLRLRAEGLEKVVTSMLDQPPPIHPIVEDITTSPPTSPKLNPTRDPSHPHTLPNGVRLRLAMCTVINDLFARQAPPPPFRHQQQSVSSPSVPVTSNLPPALSSISLISAYTPPYSDPSAYLSIRQKQPLKPNARVLAFYTAGTDPSTANSPPAFRCPRHLHTGCEICVSAKTGSRPGITPRVSSGVINKTDTPEGGGITGWRDGSGIGSGLARPPVNGCVLRRNSTFGDGDNIPGGGNTRISELIPRFLRLSALVAAELGLEIRDREESGSKESTAATSPGYMNDPETPGNGEASAANPRTAGQVPQVQEPMHAYALRPSREWYMLLAGLLTRAALEGYLSGGWCGPDAVECLLTCGMSIHEAILTPDEDEEDEEDTFIEFEPDEFPSLLDSVRVLFPSTRGEKIQAEEEYEAEMDERLRRFYDVPVFTPDLSTHMEDLAWSFPAEPVERAAVRFCEAMARWRGKPELENYKKRGNTSTSTPAAGSVPIESLVHTSPGSMPGSSVNSRKPSIDRYFTMPSISITPDTTWNWHKRMRTASESRPGPAKRIHV